MKRQLTHLALAAMAVFTVSCSETSRNAETTGSEETEKRIEVLLSRMTLEEKAGQMTQITLDVLTRGESPYVSDEPVLLDTSMLREAFVTYKIGSVLNTANNRARDRQTWNRLIGEIQNYALENSRLQIPVLYGLDMIHGASYVDGATLFPQQIGLAATWNPALAERAGEITAYESRAVGCPWTFSPVLDLGMDPRWPRQWETFGEDPLLGALMGEALIKGLQGKENSLDDPNRIAACLKHYLGYSSPVSGKDRTPAHLPMHVIREYHLPAFKKAIETGAMSVMVNSGEINGLPVHASHALITGLLKEELGFSGLVVTDWQDIEFLHTRHRIAASHKEAVKIAVNAGIDMSMVPYNFNFAAYVVELVKEGEISTERIDDAVRRILRLKFRLGLFERPVTAMSSYPEFASGSFAADARRTALESITLLKNENKTLPLPAGARILIAGPAADRMRPLLGGWSYSWQGNLADEFTAEYATIARAMRELSASPANIRVYEGVSYDDSGDFSAEIKGDLQKITALARQSDYVVLCLGENSYCEIPGNITELELSSNQKELVRAAASSGKPVILVMVQGRPRIIREVEPMAQAILNAYLPGNYGGEAIARILYGETNPSGKLPYTYPRFAYSIEPYYHKYTENLQNIGAPEGSAFNPQYPFGFGLSYSEFAYSGLSADGKTYTPDATIRIRVNVQNNSGKAGMEVVQAYVSDLYATLTPPVKRLRAFTKIMLQPGEMRTVTLEIPVRDLAFTDHSNASRLENGEFILSVGGQEVGFSVEGAE